MKKINIFYTCAAAALVFASCQKAEETPQPVNTVPVYLETIEAHSPSVPVRTMTNDGVNILWQDGDRIGLRPYTEGDANANGIMVEYETSLSEPSASATFVRAEGEEDPVALRGGVYIALYPSDPAYCNWSGKHEQTVVGIPYNQVLPAGGGFYRKSSIMIATAAEGESFCFKHAMAYINFEVDSNSPTFDKLVISSNSGTVLTERITLKYDATYDISTNNNYKSTSVTVTTDQSAAFTPGSYYAAILPQTYTGGLTFTFYNGEELIGIKSIDANVVLERGDVARMGTIGSFAGESLPDPLQVATVYAEGGVNQGVVFSVDASDPYKGKIISKGAQLKWSTISASVGTTSSTDGLANFDLITSLDAYKTDPNNYPATKYCDDLRTQYGGNWRLPVLSDIQELYIAYYGLTINSLVGSTDYRLSDGNVIPEVIEAKMYFDSKLVELGDASPFTTLDGDANNDGVSDNDGYGTANGVNYWISKQNSNGNAQIVRIGIYNNSNGAVTNNFYVRCVRDVELK